jgi:glycosyltransferase involved in cell wall biosynthesis
MNAESIYAIHWISGYLKKNMNILVISPYDLKVNYHFNDLKRKVADLDSINLYQISGKFGVLSNNIIFRYLKTFVYLLSMKRNYKFAIFHVHNLKHLALFGLILNPQKIVVSPYGSDVYLISRLRKYLVKLLIRRADFLNPHSEFMRKRLITEFGVSSKKMITLHTGVDFTKWKKPSDSSIVDYRKRLGIPREAVVFLSYRNFQPLYQIHLLPIIHSELLRQDISAFFIYITGIRANLSYVTRIKAQIQNGNLSKHTKLFETVLKSEEIARLLYTADYFFSIPKWDQFAATVQEGMYCECIPILSDLKVYTEAIEDEGAVISDTASKTNLIANILKAVKSKKHLDSLLKRTNKNIIIKKFDMEKNMSEIVTQIISQF